jgi:hypothetical protein
MSSGLTPEIQSSTQFNFQSNSECSGNNTDIKPSKIQSQASVTDYKYNPDDVNPNDVNPNNSTCVEGTRGCIIACTKSTGVFDQACFQQCKKTTFIC